MLYWENGQLLPKCSRLTGPEGGLSSLSNDYSGMHTMPSTTSPQRSCVVSLNLTLNGRQKIGRETGYPRQTIESVTPGPLDGRQKVGHFTGQDWRARRCRSPRQARGSKKRPALK